MPTTGSATKGGSTTGVGSDIGDGSAGTIGITSAGAGIPAVSAGADSAVGTGGIDSRASDSSINTTIITITTNPPAAVGNSRVDDDRIIATGVVEPLLAFRGDFFGENKNATIFGRGVGKFTFEFKLDAGMLGFGVVLFIHKGGGDIPKKFIGAGMVKLDRVGRIGKIDIKKINFLFKNWEELWLIENKFFHNPVAGNSITKVDKGSARLGNFGIGNAIVLSLASNFLLIGREKTEGE